MGYFKSMLTAGQVDRITGLSLLQSWLVSTVFSRSCQTGWLSCSLSTSWRMHPVLIGLRNSTALQHWRRRIRWCHGKRVAKLLPECCTQWESVVEALTLVLPAQMGLEHRFWMKCQVTVKGRNVMFLAKREKVMFNGSAQWLYKNIYCINGNDWGIFWCIELESSWFLLYVEAWKAESS